MSSYRTFANHRAWLYLLMLLQSTQPGATASNDPDPVIARGLAHAVDDREQVEEAIERANRLLVDEPLRLRTAWSAAAEDSAAVPVHAVLAPDSPQTTPAAVPRGCRCIFVDTAALVRWIGGHEAGAGRQSLDHQDLLAFMLLHEVGHILDGSYGADFAHGGLTQLNIEPSLAKAAEEKADAYAAALVRRHFYSDPPSDATLAAGRLSMVLGNLSWNMQAYRTLDEFGASVTGKRSVYFDHGYSHPNLAWRVVRSNHLIHDDEATAWLLRDFENSRAIGANPQPLYRRED